MWSKVKQFVRRAHADTKQALEDAVAWAVREVTAQDSTGWIEHSGYRFQLRQPDHIRLYVALLLAIFLSLYATWARPRFSKSRLSASRVRSWSDSAGIGFDVAELTLRLDRDAHDHLLHVRGRFIWFPFRRCRRLLRRGGALGAVDGVVAEFGCGHGRFR